MRAGTVTSLIGAFSLILSSVSNASPFTEPGPDAFKKASTQMNLLDRAMNDGSAILKTGELKAVAAHSQHFKSLVNSGQALFGSSTLDPLGYCSAAGVYAQSWWQAQVVAARRGGTESVPGSLSEALQQFRANSAECLKSALPNVSAESLKDNQKSECLTVFGVDPKTKEMVEKAKPDHCKR
ncbi:hypothetical protein [Pseudomonas veronii]